VDQKSNATCPSWFDRLACFWQAQISKVMSMVALSYVDAPVWQGILWAFVQDGRVQSCWNGRPRFPWLPIDRKVSGDRNDGDG
jgi:hypothetical protein